ncbi:MAG: GGDEF domain-containing protein [Solibacillus sp.]
MNLSTQLPIEVMKQNIRQTKTMIYIVFAFILWTLFINTAGRIYIYPVIIPFFKGYLLFYGIIIIINFIGFYFIQIKKWTVTQENLRRTIWLYATYNLSILVCLTAISITDAFILGHVAVFEMFILLAAVLYSTPRRYLILLATIFTATVITSIIMSEKIEQIYSYILCGNVLIFAIVGIYCSHTVSNARINLLKQEIILREQNVHNEKLMTQLAEQNKKLSNLMQHDPLTGLYNRRAFNEYMSTLSNEKITFIMLDIDCFKCYNDHYGHIEGDTILIKIAEVLQATAQTHDDFVARWGGEEFMYITLKDNGEQLAEIILQNVHDAAIPHEASTVIPYVTVSIGVYTAKIDPHTPLSYYYEQADKALYASKRNGRNQYTVYEETTIK